MKIDTKFKKKLGWRLLALMGEYKIRTAAQLARKLNEHGVEITSIHLARLLNELPTRINTELLEAFCNIFNCTPNDLMPLLEAQEEKNEPAKVVPEVEAAQEVKPPAPSKVVPLKKKEAEEQPPRKKKPKSDFLKDIMGPELGDDE